MDEPVMKYGARKGRMNAMRQWIARASAKEILIFPVPGADVMRLYQAETEMDARLTANPRESNVLLVVGELTESLALKAGVAYQQIPRPRVLVVASSVQPPYLPEPDVQVSLGDGFLDEALPQVRQLLRDYAWSEEAEPWKPEFLTEMVEDSENGGGHDHHDHDHGNGNEDEEAHDHHGGDNHGDDDDSSGEHNHNHEHDHGGDDEDGSQDHGDMDFMSMVAMTKDLPRPKDGLPMNRSEVYFGPFHPGLPGGLSVFMELDGDTVIKASVEAGLTARSIKEVLPVDAKKLPDLLAELNPLTPQSYRLLAQKALADALHNDDSMPSNVLGILENERIASHLNWLATFAKTVGNEWMHRKATRWHVLYRSGEVLPEKLHAFMCQIRSMPYLQTKLSVGGIIPDTLLHHLTGPAAKAAGKMDDARSDDEYYRSLGWHPVTTQANSAWGRLLVRFDEIEQSLELIQKATDQQTEREEINFSGSGKGAVKLESPRGTLKLSISVENGAIEKLQIESPSKPLAALVPTLTDEAELSDALVQIASLDISPWEIKGKTEEVE